VRLQLHSCSHNIRNQTQISSKLQHDFVLNVCSDVIHVSTANTWIIFFVFGRILSAD